MTGLFRSPTERSSRSCSAIARSTRSPSCERWQPSLTAAGEPARLEGDLVSPDYFAALGVRPSLGRDFAAADDVTGAPPVVIVTASFAERRFGSAAAVLDRTITLDGESYTVIGVMPEGFENALSPAVEVWAPLRYLAGQPFESREWGHNLRMVGRLREGVTLEQAQREMRHDRQLARGRVSAPDLGFDAARPRARIAARVGHERACARRCSRFSAPCCCCSRSRAPTSRTSCSRARSRAAASSRRERRSERSRVAS